MLNLTTLCDVLTDKHAKETVLWPSPRVCICNVQEATQSCC